MKRPYHELDAAKVFFLAASWMQIAFTALFALFVLVETRRDGGVSLSTMEYADADWLSLLLACVLILGFMGCVVVNRVSVMAMNALFAKNVRFIGRGSSEHSPGWSVAYYFIPVINLFRPYQSMKESIRVPALARGKSVSLSPLKWWWTLHLVINVVTSMAFRGGDINVPALCLLLALFIAYLCVCIVLVSRVIALQREAIFARLEEDRCVGMSGPAI